MLPLQACRDFNDDGTCKDTCPPLTLYDRKIHQLVSNPNAKFTYGATCVKACPRRNSSSFPSAFFSSSSIFFFFFCYYNFYFFFLSSSVCTM